MVKEVFGYLHSHWDREWYKSFEEYRLRLCDVLDDIFKKIECNQINCFYLDGQTIALEDYLEIYPEKFEYIKKLINTNKLFIGPHYVLADEFLVFGESLIRNLKLGIEYSIKCGTKQDDFIGYLPDAFGHNAWMPMILSKANIQNALVWRGVNSPSQQFYWEAPSGEKIKTIYLPFGYYQDFFTLKSYKKNINNLLFKAQEYSKENLPILLPIGADHLACEDNIKAKIKNFNRNNKNFKMKLSSINEYLKLTEKSIPSDIIIGELRDNSNSYILPSVLSSRVYLKQENIKTQWKLIKIVEPLCAYAQKENIISSKQNNLKYVWKKLLQNQAHDSICGCCIDVAHQENLIRYSKINQICDAIVDSIKAKLSNKISKNEIAIFNLSDFDYSGVYSFYSDKKLNLPVVNKFKSFPIEISQDIHNIPVQENYHYYYEYLAEIDNLKANSVSVVKPYYEKDVSFRISLKNLENEFLDVTLNANGTLNLFDKISNKKYENIFKITDEADVGDSYNFSCIPNENPVIAKFESSKIVESNALRKILRVVYSLNIPSHAKNSLERSKKLLKHIFYVDLILCKNSNRLDIKINYENLSKNHILKLNFNMPKTIDSVISEDSFGVIKRNYVLNYDYKKHLPTEKYKETNLNTNPLQRFLIAQDLTILTKGLQEYWVNKNNLDITLLRSFGEIAKKTLLTRTAAAGPPLPTPEGQCIGKQQAEISLFINNDINIAFKEADKFYNPLVIIDGKAKQTSFKNKVYFDFPDGLYTYSLTEANDKNGIILKIFNYSDKLIRFNFNDYQTIFETDLLENSISENLANANIEIASKELKIFKLQ